MKQGTMDGVVRVLSTSYCFYVLALLAVVEYYALLGSLGDTLTLQEAQAQVRFSPPLVTSAVPTAVVDAPIALVEQREPYTLGDTRMGCRVRWSHPRQSWDGFNLPCPAAIAEQVSSKRPNALVQVASVVPQNRVNNKAQCVHVNGRWFCMPNFLVVGAPFAGSTTLLRWLVGHPRIAAPAVDGPDYLNVPKGEIDDVWHYFAATCPSEMALSSPPVIPDYEQEGEMALAGDDHGPQAHVSPWTVGDVACFDHAPSLLAQSKAAITTMRAPWSRSAQKIVLLRDPVDRLISQFFSEHPDWDWKDLKYAVKVSCGDFRECACNKIPKLGESELCQEASITSSGTLWPLSVPPIMEKAYSQCKRHLEDTFLDEGFYHIHIQTWLAQGFKESQFKVVLFEGLKHNTMETMSAVFQHVGLALKGAEMLELEERLLSQYGRTSFPDGVPIQERKSTEATEVRSMLRTLYSSHNARLNTLTEEKWGVSLPWL